MRKIAIMLQILLTLNSASAEEIIKDVINPFFKDAQAVMKANHPEHKYLGTLNNTELRINLLQAHNNQEAPDSYKYGENELQAYADSRYDKKSLIEIISNFGEVTKRSLKNKASNVAKLMGSLSYTKLINISLPIIDEKNKRDLLPTLVRHNISEFIAVAPLAPSKLITHFAEKKKSNKMTWVQTELLESYPHIAKKVFPLAIYATEIAVKYFKDTRMYLNDADAFKHAFWNAMMVKYINQDYARVEATAREIWNHGDKLNPTNANQMMDMFNNNIGRELGAIYGHLSDDEIALKIINEIKNGNLFMLEDGKRSGRLIPSRLNAINILDL